MSEDKTLDELKHRVHELESEKDLLENVVSALRVLQIVLEADDTGVLCVDPSGIIIQFNASATKVIGSKLYSLQLCDLSELSVPTTTGDIFLCELYADALENDRAEMNIETENGAVIIRASRLHDGAVLRGVVFHFVLPLVDTENSL